LILKTSTDGFNINIGPTLQAGALNISPTDLDKLQGFDSIIFGQASDRLASTGQSTVTLAAIDYTAHTSADISVYAEDIVLVSSADGVLKVSNGLMLDSKGDISINDTIQTSDGNLQVISNNGDIAMSANTSLIVHNGSIVLRASGDISLSKLQADTGGTLSQAILQSVNGNIVAATSSASVDISADVIVMRGLGLAEGESGDALEVKAGQIVIDVPGSIVFQDVSPDGKVHFMAMKDGVLYEQLANQGDVVRQTMVDDSTGDNFVQHINGGSNSLESSATLGLFNTNPFTFRVQDSASSATPSYLAGKADITSANSGETTSTSLSMWIGNQDLLVDEYGVDSDLLDEHILASSTFSSGQSGGSDVDFEYWVESLSL
jgi:hypothetical protein